jgi:predicted dehydrogenase
MPTDHTPPSAEPILLVGAGQMAIDYNKVLAAFGIAPMVFGRGKASADRFRDATGLVPSTGSLNDQIAGVGAALPATAIVTVNAHQLAEVSGSLIRSGVRRLLVEKPAALDLSEADGLLAVASAHGAEVCVAYNRRFLASVMAAQDIIAADGGALSVKFDFSEPARRIATLGKPARELKTWFYGNSTHVLDLAFHLAGPPTRLSGDVSGGSVIDPDTGIFAGHGLAGTGCHVTWHANWVAPGRWGVEVLTRENRLILQPLEKLRKQTHAGFAEVEHPIDDADDLAFKPGLLKQTRAFLTGDGREKLLPLAEHVRLMRAYEAIRTGAGWQAGA